MGCIRLLSYVVRLVFYELINIIYIWKPISLDNEKSGCESGGVHKN